MNAIRELVQSEIDRLRRDAENLRMQAKALSQKADALEHELGESLFPASGESSSPRLVERGGRAEAIVNLLDAQPNRVFNVESMQSELGVRVDPSLVSRLKREGKIAKAKIGGYCSTKSPSTIKDDEPRSSTIQEVLVG